MAEETGTYTYMDEKCAEPPPSKWFGINKNLIMLKITLFFLYGVIVIVSCIHLLVFTINYPQQHLR